MKSLLIFAIVSLWGNLPLPPEKQHPGGHPLEDFLWLKGTWKDDARQVYEEWKISGDSLVGRSYIVNNGYEKMTEKLLLVKRNDTVFYIAHVVNTAEPVEFTCESHTDGKFIFTNPTHDYPQKIVYEKKDKKTILATISMTDGSRSFSLHYRKISD